MRTVRVTHDNDYNMSHMSILPVHMYMYMSMYD